MVFIGRNRLSQNCPQNRQFLPYRPPRLPLITDPGTEVDVTDAKTSYAVHNHHTTRIYVTQRVSNMAASRVTATVEEETLLVFLSGLIVPVFYLDCRACSVLTHG